MSRDLSYLLDQPSEDQHCGFVAIIGRPNVGKSTLMNNILGQKLSITSRKPQTTRHQIVGIKTEGDVQAVYVDTPGLHKDQDKAINRYMNKAASSALRDVDVVVFIIDRTAWTEEDEIVFEKLGGIKCPVILVINKIDQLDDKESLLPHLEILSQKMNFLEIIPISAKTGASVDRLEAVINEHLPKSIHFYPDDQITDRSSRFLAAELVREKLMRNLGEEVPYGTTVEIEEFKRNERGILIISALILVEREGQKRIVIGDKGDKIKGIGRDARLDMEKMFDSKVMLNLWVKVRSNWSDDERALRSLGYNDIE